MNSTINCDTTDMRRDPEVLGQLLDFATKDLAQGGDASSICPMFPSHLSTVQKAARECASMQEICSGGDNDSTRLSLKPEWPNLFTLMFHCYFQYTQRDVFQDTLSDPLICALVLVCECPDLKTFTQTDATKFMLAVVLRCVSAGLSSPDSGERVASFFSQLKVVWNIEKNALLASTTTSLMPWSADSIRERSVSALASAAEQAEINPEILFVASQCENPLRFPDMLWLGASHDGHPRNYSIMSYVSARWSPSFTAHDNAALWQAALTFGVLESITGCKIPEALLLERRSDGTVVFTCRNMGVLVYHWIFRVFHDGNEDGTRRKESLDALVLARKALSAACDTIHPDPLNGLCRLPRDTVDSIVSNISIILDAFYSPAAASPTDGLFDCPSITEGYAQRVGDIFLQKMVADGWCPSLRHVYQPQYWQYASSFKPFLRYDQHEHDKCSATGCVAYTIPDTAYTPQHATPGCSCRSVYPSLTAIGSVLRSGAVPVISYSDGALSVHVSSDAIPYVAISHVRGHGLGTTIERGLPTCQIQRIHRHVKQLLGPDTVPAFWIDGLCIPDDKDLRTKANVMMRQTYEGAAMVLVLDASIRALCSSANAVEENIFRIGTSTWMQRVWTLQEALLARELYFEFSSGVVPASDLLQALCERASARCDAWVTPALCVARNTSTVAVIEPSITGDKPTFSGILALLHCRSMSRPEDEPLAIAGLLDVNPEKIMSQPDLQSRIRTLLVEVGTVPRDMIFHDSDRMRKPGFRWCPTSLTSVGRLSPTTSDSESLHEAVCTADGLTTKGEMLVLCLPRIYVFDDTDTCVFVKVLNTGTYYSLESLLKSLRKGGLCSVNALLLQRDELPLLPQGEAFRAVAVDIPEVDDALDVQITEKSVLHCEYVMRTDVTSCGDSWDFVMDGHPIVEGQLVRAKVKVT